MNKKIIDRIFFIISFFLIFNNTPKIIQMNLWGGHIGWKLVFYPLVAGIIYTLYCQYKYKNVLVYLDEFLKFIFVYIVVTMLSLIIGLYTYPYYDVVFNGPVSQIEKLPKVMDFFASHGIVIDQKFALGTWLIARQVKGVLLETFWCFGGAYMIFCWYHKNWQQAVRIMTKGVLAGLVVVFAYSVIEIFYLAGNEAAEGLLVTITPYFHPIKTNHGWWPPLLWKGQLRSVFSEPSMVGNYISIVIPVLFCCYLRNVSKAMLLISGTLMFLVFLTKARTAYAMLFGMLILMFLFGRLQVQIEQDLSSNYISRIHLIKKSVEQFIRSVVA